MPMTLAAIAVGATLGAWLRWGLALWLNPTHAALSPGTLAANWIGALAIGGAVGWLESHPGTAPAWRAFAITGLLGGLTTFSTFSMEAVALLQRGQWGWAAAHVALHVAGSLAVTALGLWLAR